MMLESRPEEEIKRPRIILYAEVACSLEEEVPKREIEQGEWMSRLASRLARRTSQARSFVP